MSPYPPRVARTPRTCRLLLVIHRLDVGGAELQLVHLARGLAELGHAVTVCCIDDIEDNRELLERSGVEIVTLGARTRAARLAAVPRLARLARRADVVQCTMWDASLWGRLAAIVARRPVVVADHATDRSVQVAASGAARGSWIAIHNRLLDRFTTATVACAGTQRALLEAEGVAPSKIVHIPNGVPVDEIARAAAQPPSREALGIPADARVALHVGVFRPEKNQAGALESIAAVRERLDDVHLVFVGDGDTRAEIERRARERGWDWAHFLGFRDDVAALLGLADILILPSTSDAMPMTVLEAMAAGVPVVASDVGDIAATVGDGGICVPAGDAAAFAAACERLLGDPRLHAETAAAARERAAAFDAGAMVERYSDLLVAACDGRPAVS